VRQEYAHQPYGLLLKASATRQVLFDDIFGPIDEAYKHSYLVHLIQKHKPNVIVDSINTATAISYQDVDSASQKAMKQLHSLEATQLSPHQPASQGEDDENENHGEAGDGARDIEALLLRQAVPQLTRHVLLLDRAMREVGTRLYLKIGTTGTGGMGLNIPYTHSEDRPSAQLIAKTAVAFAHTGLLFLMARTPDGPIVKEIKPGGMVGYADSESRIIPDKRKPRAFVRRYEGRVKPLETQIILEEPETDYQDMGMLTLPVINTGENGFFTKGEFETITALGQMEFITPEEIAHQAVLEIRGSNTGHDVIASIDGSVMNPTYRAGYLRQAALVELAHLEEETGSHSVALGQLGPPELSKLLWEAELLKLQYRTLSEVLAARPDEIAQRLYARVEANHELRQSIVSLGLPILSPNGTEITRGPYIRIPEVVYPRKPQSATGKDIDRWVNRGWVDLRPKNMTRWQERFRKMTKARGGLRGGASANVTRQAYIYDDIRIGEVVAWIFKNEEGGYRVK
jgi:uncharacterized protein YdbL (DUF1318 family)